MVKIKANKRPNYRHILISDDKNKVIDILKNLDLKVKPKFREIFVKDLKKKISGKIILTVAREDVNKVRKAFEGKIRMIRTSGTLKGLLN